MISGTSSVSGLVFFVKGVGTRAQNCTVLCKSMHRSSVFHLSVCTYFLQFSFVSVSLVLLCKSVLVLYRSEVCIWHDFFVSFMILFAAHIHSFVALCALYFLSLLLVFLLSQFFPFHLLVVGPLDLLLSVKVVLPWSCYLILLLLLSWFHWLSHRPQVFQICPWTNSKYLFHAFEFLCADNERSLLYVNGFSLSHL